MGDSQLRIRAYLPRSVWCSPGHRSASRNDAGGALCRWSRHIRRACWPFGTRRGMDHTVATLGSATMEGPMSLSRGQWMRALLVLAGNFAFLGLLLAVIGLSFMKFLAFSGTAHPETIGYHVSVYAPYFVATTAIVVLWRGFQGWSGQSEVFSQFESAREESEVT